MTLPNGVIMGNIGLKPHPDVWAAGWLRSMPPDVVEKLRALSDRIAVGDKALVYAHGAEQKWLWGVVAGQVRVHVALNEMEPTLGHIHHVGAWFGESEPLLEVPGLVEMRASGETTVEKIAYARFRRLANEHPELWEGLARLTAMNQVLAMTAANDLALRTGRKRLAAALLRLSGQRAVLQGSLEVAIVKTSQQDIAGLANLALSKVSAHLGALAGANLIRLEYGRIRILDPDGLQDVINH